MELSAIGEQVFAVESIVKRRVRKVTDIDSAKKQNNMSVRLATGHLKGTHFWEEGMLLWMLMKRLRD